MRWIIGIKNRRGEVVQVLGCARNRETVETWANALSRKYGQSLDIWAAVVA